MNWLTPELMLQFVIVVLGFVLTVVTTKYRNIVAEIKGAVQTYKDAMEDGEISKEEKQQIAKECLDILMAIIRLKWKI